MDKIRDILKANSKMEELKPSLIITWNINASVSSSQKQRLLEWIETLTNINAV